MDTKLLICIFTFALQIPNSVFWHMIKKGSMDILMDVTFIQACLTSFYHLNFFSKVISNNNIKTDLFLWRKITFTGVVHFRQCLGYNKFYNEFKLSFVLVCPDYYNTYHKVRFLKIDILCFYHTE